MCFQAFYGGRNLAHLATLGAPVRRTTPHRFEKSVFRKPPRNSGFGARLRPVSYNLSSPNEWVCVCVCCAVCRFSIGPVPPSLVLSPLRLLASWLYATSRLAGHCHRWAKRSPSFLFNSKTVFVSLKFGNSGSEIA